MRLILELKEKEHLIFKQNVVLAKYRKRYTHTHTHTTTHTSRNELTQPSVRIIRVGLCRCSRPRSNRRTR
jgi:hypothetical protein